MHKFNIMNIHSIDLKMIQLIAEIENGRTNKEILPLLREAAQELSERAEELEADIEFYDDDDTVNRVIVFKNDSDEDY